MTALQLFDELDENHGIDLEAALAGVSEKALRRYRFSNSIRWDDANIPILQGAMVVELDDRGLRDLARHGSARDAVDPRIRALSAFRSPRAQRLW